MINNRSVFIVCLYWFCATIVRGDVVIGPVNEAVIAGQRMAKECRVSNDSEVFKWMLTRTNGTEKELIVRKKGNTFLLDPKFNHFSFEVDKQGRGYIFSNSIETTDAGIYFCYYNPKQRQFSSHLIVFEEEPFCEYIHSSSDNLTFAMGDPISITCTANFSGLWMPSMEWRKHTVNSTGDEENVVLTKGVSTISSFNSIISTLDLIADFDEPTYFSLKIFFLSHNYVIRVDANNTPEFQYDWKSPEVIITKPEIEVVTGPVFWQIVVETATIAVNAGNWYVTSIGFVVFVSLCVVIIVGFVIRRCYVGYRRIHGLDQSQSSTNGRVFPALERAPSGDYDDIPMAFPNIYDRINDGDIAEKVTYAECQPQQQQPHPLLTQCYSRLSDETMQPLDAYDALSPYLPMDSTHKEAGIDPQIFSGGQTEENSKNRYTSMPKNGKVGEDKTDYISFVGDGENQDNKATSVRNGSTRDISDYIQPGEARIHFPQTNDEYLMPYV